ncbi:MAG: type II toxin-antitoxin system HicB family antitoxin [Fimbriimonadaceae bacterium]|nr:type II toxin-antitoxin system HicB family antitoxin [Fimbriimonadaceae bacterium]
MRPADCYAKLVVWSDADQCYVATCPDLLYGGCHGDDQQAVYAELCQAVDEVLAIYRAENRELPPPRRGADLLSA